MGTCTAAQLHNLACATLIYVRIMLIDAAPQAQATKQLAQPQQEVCDLATRLRLAAAIRDGSTGSLGFDWQQ